MDFGLGLILSFTDNATAGIGSAIQSLNGLTSVAEESSRSIDQLADVSTLSSLSIVAGQLGDTFYSMGSSIMGVFTGILSSTVNTGSQFENLRVTVNALLKDTEKADEAISKLMDFAATTPFEIDDLTGMFTTITANQLDAFEIIQGGTTGIQQELLAYVGDLMAFRPDVPAFQWANAIRNAFGGQSRSLKMALDIDIEGMLGRAWGDTPEQIAQDFADLADAIGVAGLMADSMGTWSQVLANVSDQFTRLFLVIGDTGVFAELKGALMNVTDALFEMTDADIEGIATTIAGALDFMIKPIVKVSKGIGDLIRNFTNLSKTNPKLVKFAIQVLAVAGALLTFTGVALKVVSSLSGVALVFMAMGGSFTKIKTLLITGIKTIASHIAPLALLVGGVYFVWKNDFAGIRTLVLEFANNVLNSFTTARDALSGSVEDMVLKIAELEKSGTSWDNFTLGIMKVWGAVTLLAEAWSDNTLSEDSYLKAKELGILPLIEAILDLKYRFELFVEGFIDGWTRIGEKVVSIVEDITGKVEGTFLEDALTGVTDFFQALSSGDADAWYEFGNSFADFTAKAIVFGGAISLVKKVFNLLMRVVKPVLIFFKGITSIGGFLVKLMPNVTKPFVDFFNVLKGGQGVTFFSKLVEAIKGVASGGIKLKDALGIVFGTTETAISGVMTLVGGIILALKNFFDMLSEGFSWVKEILMVVGIALAAVGAIILGAPALGAAIVGGIVALVMSAIVVIKENWEAIKEFFSNLIETIGTFFSNLWGGIVEGVSSAWEAVKSFIGGIADWIFTTIIQPVINFFMTYIYPFIEKIAEIVAKVIEIIVAIVSFVVGWIYENVITPIAEFFVELWSGIVEGVTLFVESVKEVIGVIVGWISENIITPIADFFRGLWEGIVEGVTAFIETVKEVFTAVVSWISEEIITPIQELFSALWEGIQVAFEVVADTITAVLKSAINNVFNFIGGMINGVIWGINKALDLINKIPGVSITKITELDIPQLAKGGIVSSPMNAIIGEDGAEAVIPLERNTGWIEVLAYKLGSAVEDITEYKPIAPLQVNRDSYEDNNNEYITKESKVDNSVGDVDNSVVFNEGALKVVVQNANEEEAERFAELIMEKIERKKQLKKMAKYEDVTFA